MTDIVHPGGQADQQFIEGLIDAILDAVNAYSAKHGGLHPPENVLAFSSLTAITLAMYPRELDAHVDAYLKHLPNSMREAIAGHRLLRDLPANDAN